MSDDELLKQLAKEMAGVYASMEDDTPRIFHERNLPGMRASEQIVITIRREHLVPYVIPLQELEVVV